MNLTPKIFIVLASASFSPFLGTPVQAIDDVKKINSANQALVDGRLDEALAQYDSVAETNPGNPLLAYNRGVALYRHGQVDQARQAFVKALDSDNPELAAKAGFNLGNCHYAAAVQQAETDPAVAIDSLRTAIAHYRSALQSNAADTDSRTNIELASRLIKQLQQKEEQKQEEQKPDQQQQDPSQSEQDQSDQSESQDENSGEQNFDESESEADENKANEQSSQQDDGQQEKSDESTAEQPEADKNESDESNSGEQGDEENPSKEESDGSKADQSEQEPTEDQSSTGSDNKDQDQQPEQESSGQPADQPQSEEHQNDQPSQAEPGQQQENEAQQESGQQMSAGNADQQDQPDDGQQTPGYDISQTGEPGDSIDKEEAMKMLQAIRDRDLMRRTQKLNETRRRYRPVDRDW